jgi:hypothetical protein
MWTSQSSSLTLGDPTSLPYPGIQPSLVYAWGCHAQLQLASSPPPGNAVSAWSRLLKAGTIAAVRCRGIIATHPRPLWAGTARLGIRPAEAGDP